MEEQKVYSVTDDYSHLDRKGYRFIDTQSSVPITLYGFTFLPGYTVIDMSKEGEVQDKFFEFFDKDRSYYKEHNKCEFPEREKVKIKVMMIDWHFHI